MKLIIRFVRRYWQSHSIVQIRTGDNLLFNDILSNEERRKLLAQLMINSTRQTALGRLNNRYNTVEQMLERASSP
jgi:hypothetical protein